MRQRLAVILVLALAVSLALATQGQASAPRDLKAPGGVRVPHKPPANAGSGAITKADVEYFEHWTAEFDKADETLREGVESGGRGCVAIKAAPAEAQAAFERAMEALEGPVGKLDELWQGLGKQAEALKGRAGAYSDQSQAEKVTEASRNLYFAYLDRRSGDVLGLQPAISKLGSLECSVHRGIAFYQDNREKAKKDFEEGIAKLQSLIAPSA